jgi:hypothetical protein
MSSHISGPNDKKKKKRSKKEKTVMYVSLKDLKKMGLLPKKRKKRGSTKKQKRQQPNKDQPNPRSSSDHMVGYGSYLSRTSPAPPVFSGTSSLQDEYLRNKNKELEQQIENRLVTI